MTRTDSEKRGDLMNQLAAYVCQLDAVGAWGLIDLLIEMEAVNHTEAWWLMSELMAMGEDE
jgi:hypothetical protein